MSRPVRPVLKKDDHVHDKGWPWRLGVVIRVLKTRVHVQWTGGEVWNYDLPHTQFLVKER
jgi:hypothetical protein